MICPRLPDGLYFHGGPRGLREILPPAKTGARGTIDLLPHMDTRHVRSDRVFLTTDFTAAVMFAACHPAPMVYVVAPDGPVEPDPDYSGPEGESVQTESARVVRTIKPRTKDVLAVRRAILA